MFREARHNYDDEEKCIIELSDERCEEIKAIIADLFKRLNIKSIPINAFEIAYSLGIKLVPYSSKSQEAIEKAMKESDEGFSVMRDGQWYIFYNDLNRNYGRISNTIMHEVGHIVLDHTEDSEFAEKEVKFFAKYALAPPPLIHKYINLINSPDDICSLFEISYEAAEYALSYYDKWIRYGQKDYTDYEIQITEQVTEICIAKG